MALHDELTGLPTLHLLEERARQALALANRRGSQVGVLHLDLVSFGEVNETYGRSHGDRLLSEVARRLRAIVRSTDTIAKVGGDDFALVLTAVDGAEGMSAAIERLVETFDSPFRAGQKSVELRCRIGAALFPDHGRTPRELLARARSALDRAAAEDEEYVIFDTEAGARTVRAAEAVPGSVTVEELREAMDTGELALFYQPVVDLEQDRMVGAEGLVRWRRDADEVLSAAEFVPLAEREGLIADVDRFVLGRAVARLAERSPEDREGRLEWISVNVGAQTFHGGWLPDQLRDLLGEHDVDASDLILEITERTALMDPGATRETAEALRKMGVRLALDDFGTGFAALAHLRPHPVDFVKIEMHSVRQLQGPGTAETGGADAEDGEADEGEGDAGEDNAGEVGGAEDNPGEVGGAVVDALVRLGHALDMDVVTEGVESERELAWAREAGCDYAQGFHLSRPVPPQELGDVELPTRG